MSGSSSSSSGSMNWTLESLTSSVIMGMQAPKQVPRLCSTIAFPSGLVTSLGAGSEFRGFVKITSWFCPKNSQESAQKQVMSVCKYFSKTINIKIPLYLDLDILDYMYIPLLNNNDQAEDFKTNPSFDSSYHGDFQKDIHIHQDI